MSSVQTGTIETRIPSRLDRLPWARFHWMVILGLGTVWILDGLEVTIVSSVASRMTEDGSGISLSVSQVGTAAAIYVTGACLGALFFGQLCDRFGRKKLFILTLAIYIVSTVVTAFSFAPWFFFLARFFTGAGIGGEYAAINSAIDELIPARVRGRVDLIINGTYWLGSAGGSAAALFFLDTGIFPKDVGWRLAFGLGAVLGLTIMLVRRHVPESPRWLFIHGREEEAERIVGEIEEATARESDEELPEVTDSITVRQRTTIPFREIARVAFRVYPRRSVLCISLFVGQAFLYNGLTFNLGTLMSTFFDVGAGTVPVFIIIYALGNFLGPLTLGRLFDTVGRKPMIAITYLGSAAVSVVLAFLFVSGVLTAGWFIAIVVVVFFLASAGASAAYLTASEIFPMETRALAIAFFYAIGTAAGGITGPLLFGKLIATGVESDVMIAFLVGAVVMAIGGIVELLFGVKAERAQLEDVAKPLTADEADAEAGESGAAPEPDAAGRRRGTEGEPEPPELEPLRAAARQARARAADERARAAEHRATAHELLAVADDASGREGATGDDHAARAEAERVLAEIADLTARAHDEYATACDERAAAATADGEHRVAAARERAAAAEDRARAHEHDAAARAGEGTADRERHAALSSAALERARAREQRALAEEARAQGDEAGGSRAELAHARATLHDRWAEMHVERARAREHRAAGDDAASAEASRTADALEQRARAAAERMEAAERRAEAQDVRPEHEATAGEAARRRERATARDAAERRVRERLERRRRQASGLRRFRPGPGRTSSSPGFAVSAPLPEQALDNEIATIERALRDHGATNRQELARLVGARYWGPGVFRAALREAVAEGAARRLSRTTFAPPADPPDGD